MTHLELSIGICDERVDLAMTRLEVVDLPLVFGLLARQFVNLAREARNTLPKDLVNIRHSDAVCATLSTTNVVEQVLCADATWQFACACASVRRAFRVGVSISINTQAHGMVTKAE